MKKILLLMMCCPVILSAQNGVTVSGLDVKSGTVTFNVSWKKADMPAVWSDSVWVFVDYNKAGRMERLPLSGATLTAPSWSDATVIFGEDGNKQGAWVVGNARSAGSFSATVQLLTATADLAGVCAYASNYPPVGEYASETDVEFTGTPMYNIVLEHERGGTITRRSDSPFSVPASYTVQSFTDATGAPGHLRKLPVHPPQAASAQTWSFANSKLIWSDRINSTQVDCNTPNRTSTSGTAPEYMIYTDLYYYNWYCFTANEQKLCPSPWRIPTKADLDDMLSHVTISDVLAVWGETGLVNPGDANRGTGYLYIPSVTPVGSDQYYYRESGWGQAAGRSKLACMQVRCVKNP
jgi:hypothetical protein